MQSSLPGQCSGQFFTLKNDIKWFKSDNKLQKCPLFMQLKPSLVFQFPG